MDSVFSSPVVQKIMLCFINNGSSQLMKKVWHRQGGTSDGQKREGKAGKARSLVAEDRWGRAGVGALKLTEQNSGSRLMGKP